MTNVERGVSALHIGAKRKLEDYKATHLLRNVKRVMAGNFKMPWSDELQMAAVMGMR